MDQTGKPEPLVSVVTPFYNTEAYLAQCIESVLAQTYHNFEYLLVNNCSTDGSRSIAQTLAARDSRIRLLENDHFLSQIENYNHALLQISAHSKYCKMVQADDMLFQECLARMVGVAERYPKAGIIGAYGLHGRKVSLDGLRYPDDFFPGREICRLFLLNYLYVFGSPTSLLFRSDLVRSRERFFSNFGAFEDADVCFDLLKECDFGFVHQVLTFTRVENDSIFSPMRSSNYEDLFRLMIIRKYGPVYLGGAEYESSLKRVERRYLKYLAENLVFRREKDFWQFHHDNLSVIDYELTRSKLRGPVISFLADLLFNPKKAAGMALRRLRKTE